MIYQRTELLIGKNNLDKLKNSHVAVFGLGGVGGFVVEALARVGVGELSLIDFDTVDITNLNRQIIATQDTIGRLKSEVMQERIRAINPDIKVNIFAKKFLPSNKEEFFQATYSYVVDAIDLVTCKLALVEICNKKYSCNIIYGYG